MSDYRLSREEMETVILGNAASQTWDLCTADPKIIRKMERQGYQPDKRANPWGYTSFTVPFNRIGIRKSEGRKATGKPFQRDAVSRVVETDTTIPIAT